MTTAATAAGLVPGHPGRSAPGGRVFRFDRLTEQLRRTGGCSQPIHLTGAAKTIDRTTGTLLHHYSTDTEPGGRLRIACGNRRASSCPPAPGPTQATPTASSAPASPATPTKAPRPRSGTTPGSSPL
ncbi:hypothetical protein SCALM49S_02669 [Streptomyces californicus]